jgi:hypothetical protein
MIRRILLASLLSGLCLHVAAAGIQKPAPPTSKPAEQGQEKKDPFKLFHWLTDSSESHGIVMESRKLTSLSTANLDQPPSETETEVTRPDAKSMRVTSRVYGRGPSGERILSEVVVEDLRVTAGNGISATRTTSRNDINGNLRVIRKDTQETVAAGPDTYRTQATVMRASGADSLTRSEEVVQVEKKRAAGVLEIERTQLLQDINGKWATADRRAGSSRETDGQVLWREDIYKPDANGNLILAQQNSGREWKDPQGRQHQDTDLYDADLAGKLQLSARSNMVRSPGADGTEETTQSLLRISPVSPSEGLKLVQKIVATSRPAASSTVEKEVEVQVPDANGKLQTIFYRRVQEKD